MSSPAGCGAASPQASTHAILIDEGLPTCARVAQVGHADGGPHHQQARCCCNDDAQSIYDRTKKKTFSLKSGIQPLAAPPS